MAYTPNDDNNFLTASDIGIVNAGAGNDRYVLEASLLNANQKITISDNQGLNKLQFAGGLEIVSSAVANNAIQFTLNNGAVITVLGASNFEFQTGGNGFNGTGGTTQSFADFVTVSLGVAGGLPTAGAPAVTAGPVTVNPNGGTTVVGANVAPVITSDATLAATEDTAATFAVSTVDANGDTVTVTAAAANGTVVDNNDGTFSYTGNTDFNGADTITITADDGNGGVTTQTVAVTVAAVNDAPVAAAATAAADEANTALTGQLVATDVDAGDTLSFTLDAPVGGLTVNADGSYIFDATQNATAAALTYVDAPATITANYTVTDAGGLTSQSTLTITVTPTPLTFTLVPSASSVQEGQTVSYKLVASEAVATAITGELRVVPDGEVNPGSGKASANDFVSGALNPQNVTIAVGDTESTLFDVSPQADATTEVPETFTVKAVVAGAAAIPDQTTTILDGSGSIETFVISSNAVGEADLPVPVIGSADEGSTVIFTLATTNVPPGTVYGYTLTGPGINALDVQSGSLTGTTTVGADGKAFIQVALANDGTTEGTELITLTVAGQTRSFSINDTSLNIADQFTTSAQDDIQGTNESDVFQAEITDSLQASATNTLSGGDKANGLGDVDRVVLTATSTTAAGATVNGFQFDAIEELEIRAYEQGGGVGGTGATLGLVNVTGLEKVISTTSTSNVTLNTVKNLVALEVTGNGAAGTDFTINYTGDVTNPVAGQTQTIALNNFGEPTRAGLIRVDGIETFDITTQGNASLTDLEGDALTTLNLNLGVDLTLTNLGGGAGSVIDTLTSITTGAADVGALTVNVSGSTNEVDISTGAGDDSITFGDINLDAVGSVITTNDGNDTIDGSASTGADTVDSGAGDDVINTGAGNDVIVAGAGNDQISADVGNKNINAGDGDDVVTLTGSDFNSLDTIDGGTGSDVLKAVDINDVDDAGDFTNVTNFDELAFAAVTSGTLNAVTTLINPVGITTYTFEAGINGDTSLLSVVNDVTVNLIDGTSAATDDLTITTLADTSADTVTVNVTSAGDETIGLLSVETAETLNLSFTDTATATINTLTASTVGVADDLTTLVLSGNGNMSLGALGTAVLATVDSTSTGDISLDTTTTSTAVSVTTLGGDDAITTGAGADTIDVGDGDNTVISAAGADTVTSGAGDDTIDTGAGDDVVSAGAGDNAVVAGAGNDRVTTLGGNDTINAGAGNDTVDAGAGNDAIYAGTGIDSLVGGTGADTFYFNYSNNPASQDLTSADVVKGGLADGSDDGDIDTVVIQNTTDVTLVDDIFFQWKSVEVLDVQAATDTLADADNLAGSVTLNAIAQAAGLQKVITGNGNDFVAVGEGFTSSLNVVLNGGDDTVNATLAPASSTVTVEVDDANLSLADDLVGGLGNADTLNIKATNGFAVTDATGFEKIVVVDGVDGADADTFGDDDISITLTDAVVAAGNTFVVDATALQDADASLTLDASSETNGNLSVLGGAGDDLIATGAGADTIAAGAGNDTVFAGAGNDTITVTTGDNELHGGAGADNITAGSGSDTVYGGANGDTLRDGSGAVAFRYDALSDSSTTDSDTIFGFDSAGAYGVVAGADQIQLNTGMLTGALNFAGNAANFGVAQGNLLQGDGKIDYVFQQDNNTLWVDLNDDGTLNADDLQIKLNGVTSIEAGDVASYTPGTDALSITNNAVLPISAVLGSLIIGGDGVSTLTFGGTNDITGNSLVSVENAVFDAGSNNTLTAAQYNGLVKTANASATVNLTTAGALGVLVDNVSGYNLIGGSSATVNAGELNVNISSTNVGDTAVTLDAAGDSTGTFALAGGNDSLTVATGRSLAGINAGLATTAETLNLTGAVTMTAAQHVFTTVNAAGAADSVTLTTAVNGGNAFAAVESYVLASAAGNDLTLTAAGQDVAGAAGFGDTVSGGSFVDSTSTIVFGNTGPDELNLTDGTAANDLSNVTGVEVINIANTGASAYTVLTSLANAPLTVTQTGDQDLTWDGSALTVNSSITTSGGNDVITFAGGDNNTVVSGAGDDTITLGGGNDSVDAGDDNDTIVGDGNITLADTLIGGLGDDTLTVSGNARVGGNSSGIENVIWTDTGFGTTLDFTGYSTPGSAGISLTIGADLFLEFGSDTFILSDGNDTLLNPEAIANADTIDGGAGFDTIEFNSNFGAIANNRLVNFENLVLNTALTLNLTGQTEGFTVVGSTGDDTIITGTGAYTINADDGDDTINLSLSTGINSVNGGDGNDTITSGTGAHTINAGDGADTINLSLSTGNNSVNGGDGDDTVVGGSNVTVGDTLTGGLGNDTLTLANDTAITDLNNVSGFETIAITAFNPSSYTTVDGLVAAGATLTVTQANSFGLTFNGSAELDGAFNLFGRGGSDVFTGGAGADVFTFNTSFMASNDTVNGGVGADTLNVTDVALAGNALDHVTNVETINLTIPGSAALTAVDALAAAGVDTAINVTGTGTLALNLASETNAKYNVDVTGSTGVDTVTLGVAHTVGNVGTTLVTLTGMGAGDTIDTLLDGNAAILLDLAGTFDAVTFSGVVNAGLLALGGAYTPAINNIILARFGGAAANDIYAVVDVTGNNVTADDELVHLVGTARAIDGTMFV